MPIEHRKPDGGTAYMTEQQAAAKGLLIKDKKPKKPKPKRRKYKNIRSRFNR